MYQTPYQKLSSDVLRSDTLGARTSATLVVARLGRVTLNTPAQEVGLNSRTKQTPHGNGALMCHQCDKRSQEQSIEPVPVRSLVSDWRPYAWAEVAKLVVRIRTWADCVMGALLGSVLRAATAHLFIPGLSTSVEIMFTHVSFASSTQKTSRQVS